MFVKVNGMGGRLWLTGKDLALTGVFSALFVVLNLTLGPASFQLLRLPLLQDIGVFFTLLLVAWVTGKFGPSLMVGIIGSIVAVLLGGPIIIVGFAAAAVVFDLLMSACKHNIRIARFNLVVVIISTMASGYFAGATIGVFFMGNGVQWALTIWGGWHMVGGILATAITLPIIAALERSGARKLKTE